MKGRFKASWRIVLALALVLSLGLVTAAPAVADVSPATVVLTPNTAGQSANYTIAFALTTNLVVSQNISIYFPVGTDLSALAPGDVKVDGVGAAAITKYMALGETDRVLIITLANNCSGTTVVTVEGDAIVNPTTAGAKTLDVSTTAEPAWVMSNPYTIGPGAADRIEIAPQGASIGANETLTYTAECFDAYNNTRGYVSILTNWTITEGTAFVVNNITPQTVGNWTVTGTYSAAATQTDTTYLLVTPGAVANLVIMPQPGNTTAGDPILVTVNATDAFTNAVPLQDIDAALVAPAMGELSGTTPQTTNSSGLAAFNLSICLVGSGKILTFTADSVAVNSTTFNITPGVATQLDILPSDASIIAGQNVTYQAFAVDACGNNMSPVDNVTAATNFTIVEAADAGGNWTANNNYTSEKAGPWTVEATNGTLEGTTTLNVDPAAPFDGFAISPKIESMIYGEPPQTYTATVNDMYANPIDVTDDTTFSIDGVTFDNAVGVSPDVGKWTVDGTYLTFTNNATLTVTASMCFIATAAYGTPMAEEIQILREFRDGYLLTNPLGRALVDLYYRTSPPIAQFIAEHPALQLAVRAMLVPALAMSTIAVNSTLATPITILSLLLASIVLAAWATRRRERKGPSYA